MRRYFAFLKPASVVSVRRADFADRANQPGSGIDDDATSRLAIDLTGSHDLSVDERLPSLNGEKA